MIGYAQQPKVNEVTKDLAWAVGLYEGEGYACVRASGNIEVGINMTDREPVERFHQIMGIGVVRVYPPIPPRKTYYRWHVTRCDEVVQVLNVLIESGYLSPRRLEQANKTLERAKEIKPRGWGGRMSVEKKRRNLEILYSLGLKERPT